MLNSQESFYQTDCASHLKHGRNRDYLLETLFQEAASLNRSIVSDVESAVQKVHRNLDRGHKHMFPSFARGLPNTSMIRVAAAFWITMVKPCMMEGSDVYKITEEELESFCQRMVGSTVNKNGLHFVIYMYQSKTASPTRTGSLDGTIDLAEIEWIKYWTEVVLCAKRLKLKFEMTWVDEATAIRADTFFGIKTADIKMNRETIRSYVKLYKATKLLRTPSLFESISVPLGKNLRHYIEKDLN